MHDNITGPSAGRISALQRRILVYARRRMLEQGKSLEPDPADADRIAVRLLAPDWLAKAIINATNKIYAARKLRDADRRILDGHPIVELWDEFSRAEAHIEVAAKAAGVNADIRLNRLYELTPAYQESALGLLPLGASGEMSCAPWPIPDAGRLTFHLYFSGEKAKAAEDLLGHAIQAGTAWITRPGDACPLVCTVPEMLRDLYDFPVTNSGHIDALAFNRQVVGLQRYNNANAVLRRACERLAARRLIVIRRNRDQQRAFSRGAYQRTAIGLTREGLAIAEHAVAGAAVADRILAGATA